MLAALARQTFADFLLLLFVSMLMLTPHVTAANVGMVLLMFVGLGLLRLLQSLFQLRAHLRRWKLLQRFVLSAIGQLVLGWAGIELVRGAPIAGVGSWLFAGILPLMLAFCCCSFLLVCYHED